MGTLGGFPKARWADAPTPPSPDPLGPSRSALFGQPVAHPEPDRRERSKDVPSGASDPLESSDPCPGRLSPPPSRLLSALHPCSGSRSSGNSFVAPPASE